MSIDNSSVYISGKFISNGTQVITSTTDALIRVFSVKTAELVLTVDPVLHARVVTDMSQNKFKASRKNQITEDTNAEEEDEEDQRIWSLDFDSKEELLVFGSGSRVFLFEDNTVDAENEFISNRNQQVVADQKLLNLLRNKKYEKALRVAINLDQPSRCLEILRQISLTHSNQDTLEESDDEDQHLNPSFGFMRLEDVINDLRDDQLMYLLNQASLKWNTNSKHCMIAQVVMKVTLPRIIREVIREDSTHDISSLTNIVEAMICFTERHEMRIKKQHTNSYLVQFLGDHVMKSLPVQDISLEDKNRAEPKPEELLISEEEQEEPTSEPEVASRVTDEGVEEDMYDEDLSSGEETELPKTKILGLLDDEKKKKKLMKKKASKKLAKRKTSNRM